MHDTAKEAVRRSLKRAGFKTIDVGKSVAPQVFIDKVKENNANLIAVSVNTVPAKNNLAKLDELLKASGLKDKVGIIMGGAAVKKEDADAIGAFFGKNKEEAPEIAKKALTMVNVRSSINYCRTCGNSNPQSYRFCGKCGTLLGYDQTRIY
jgi:methanogenic corrinoid protein MtbC1